MSYGADLSEPTRIAANYVGRILKGDKPADLSVQQATKMELVVNLRTAKALGLEVPTCSCAPTRVIEGAASSLRGSEARRFGRSQCTHSRGDR
jgi:ABC-type uncharacterized transport system substrate-binding protein